MAITVKQAATRLGVSKSLIYQLCAIGKLPHYRVGIGRGTIRIEERDLEVVKNLPAPELYLRSNVPLKHLAMAASPAEPTY